MPDEERSLNVTLDGIQCETADEAIKVSAQLAKDGMPNHIFTWCGSGTSNWLKPFVSHVDALCYFVVTGSENWEDEPDTSEDEDDA